MKLILLALSTLILMTLGIIPADYAAQADCGIAESLTMPVDPARFQRVQAFSAPSPRHQGRYHTGEDWSIPGGAALGEPVAAIGRGVVTYSFTLGWGRDAGVVIIRHTMPDGITLISQYGHITESEAVKFPRVGQCVDQGQLLGVIADARPAPHVHFEMRLATPDAPGPGYSWVFPPDDTTQWRSPSRLVQAYAR